MLNKKLKLSLIAIATLVASNVNAQTYYSCIPEGCSSGQYFDGVKCMRLCPEGYIWDADKTACYEEYCHISFIKQDMHCNEKDFTSNTGIKPICTNLSITRKRYVAIIPYKDCIDNNCCNTKL